MLRVIYRYCTTNSKQKEYSMRSKRLKRFMYTHVLLRDGHYPSSRTLSKQLGVTQRTIYRDMHEFRYELDAPLKYDSAQHGYHYTILGWNIF